MAAGYAASVRKDVVTPAQCVPTARQVDPQSREVGLCSHAPKFSVLHREAQCRFPHYSCRNLHHFARQVTADGLIVLVHCSREVTVWSVARIVVQGRLVRVVVVIVIEQDRELSIDRRGNLVICCL